MKINFPKLEQKTLKFWKESRFFEKSIEQRAKARDFVFYEGPPTANAKAGLHHILARVYKDIICRYKTMQGFRVIRRAGWDTHGLPVELEIEKKLGLKSKKDIEKYGIARFNKKCKESVWEYKKDWEKLTERVGFWLDMENPYITYEPEYIETLWWIIKQIYQKGLLYKDYKVVPYCPRCGTSLSSHEVALGYKRIKEMSVYIKFKILSKDKKWQDVSILSWTTTPWTLPGNVALAVNPRFTYVKVKTGKENLILAKERLKILSGDYKVLEEIKGGDLLGLKYKPLFEIAQLRSETSYKIYPAGFVTIEEGTGVVHIAVMYGEDDYSLGKRFNIPNYHTVTEEGKFIKELGEGLAGKYVKDKDTELLILDYLKRKNLLFAEELYEHDYPFCWRCGSPLLYYAKESWFIKMTEIKKDLIKNNQEINWVPAHLKEGRFGEWLKELKDWAFSRERYWGTPLPVWQCQKCKHQEIIGSKEDLLSQKYSSNNYYILRHGHSLNRVKKINVCWPEKIHCPLTNKGKKQIEKVAKELKKKNIDIIYSSDLLRTRQTAEIVAREVGIKVKFDKRIRETNVGIYDGRPIEDSRRAWGEPIERFDKRLPQGESLNDTKKRMYSFLKDINRKHKGKNILIVSHEAPISMLECALKGSSDEEIVLFRGTKKAKTGEWRKIEFKMLPYNEDVKLDFHRPYIDEVKFRCQKCGGLMERVPEVIDCWFDSGSMPFAQYHYPFENKNLIDKREQFPTDYISEAVDQTRGWFYTLLAVSTLLGLGTPYKNVISLGHVLDKKGEKMSKSKGNVVDPWYIVEKYGADATRWYFYTVNQPGDIKFFSEKDVEQALKKFILTLWNSFIFFNTYVKEKKSLKYYKTFRKLNLVNLESFDSWIISKLHELIQKVSNSLNNYDITLATRSIESFVIDDLSNWYIRRSRRRFQKPKNRKEFEDASRTLGYVLFELSILSAPFVPFLSDEIYKSLVWEPSVHLTNWPEVDEKLIDKKLEEKMERVRKIVVLALAERAKAGIKVRQPLRELMIKEKIDKELIGLIKEEVNVKKITFAKSFKLDTKITPALREEGIIREVIRQIQEMRKKAGYKPYHKILVQYFGTAELNKILTKNTPFILKETKAKDFYLKEKLKKVFDVERELKVDQKNLWLAIKKI